MTRGQRWLVLVVCCVLTVPAFLHYLDENIALSFALPVVLIGVGLFAFLSKPPRP